MLWVVQVSAFKKGFHMYQKVLQQEITKWIGKQRQEVQGGAPTLKKGPINPIATHSSLLLPTCIYRENIQVIVHFHLSRKEKKTKKWWST